jgi:hypothetical protein
MKRIVQSQFRALIDTIRTLILVEKGKIRAKAMMFDNSTGIKKLLERGITDIEILLKPVENAINSLPFSEFQNCPELASVLGDIQDTYFSYKDELLKKTYKHAQYVYAVTYYSDLEITLDAQLKRMEEIIDYLDNLTSIQYAPEQTVYVYITQTNEETREHSQIISGTEYEVLASGDKYTTSREGKVDTVSGFTVNVFLRRSDGSYDAVSEPFPGVDVESY